MFCYSDNFILLPKMLAILSYFSVTMIKCTDWNNLRGDGFISVHSSRGIPLLWERTHGSRSKRQACYCISSPVARKEQQVAPDNRTSKSTATDRLPPARLYFLRVPQPSQHHPWQIGARCSNPWACGGTFHLQTTAVCIIYTKFTFAALYVSW